jgi:putative mRNA 3-end processing factor
LASSDQLLLGEPDWPSDPFDVQVRAAGLYVGCADLYLDARRRVDRCFVSHAHTDHACALHRRTVCTAPTARFMKQRLGDGPFDVRGYGRPFRLNGVRLTLYPAGHVLGSAQLLVEHEGQRLVYTGDIKLRPSLTCEPAEVVPCDVLICEATYGLPTYSFPPTEAVRRNVVDVARRLIADGRTPVFLGYPLGRGPELSALLADAGIPVMAHESVERHLDVYREFGAFRWNVGRLDPRRARGQAIVVPFGRAADAVCRRVPDPSVIYASGWAVASGRRNRFGADHTIPLSDHADFEELHSLAEQTGAKKVYVTHGYVRPLRDALAARGIPCRTLSLGRPGRRR